MNPAYGVLMPGFPGTTLPDWIASPLRGGLVGVILFAENVPDLETTRRLTDAVRAANPAAVVSSDEEGGDVTRIQAATGSFLPGNAALGELDDVDLTRRIAAAYGRLIALAGIDLALGPCLDVASEPLNPVIGTRSFSASTAVVGAHGRAFVAGLGDAAVASCGKHFPGHGATALDSHLALPVLDVTHEELVRRDEEPFAVARPDAIMTGHLVVTPLGEEAATLASWAYRDARALGHDGPLLTDALGMRAITDRMDIGEATVRALEAGADLVLLDAPHMRDAEADFHAAVGAVTDALATGRLTEQALLRSAARNATLRRPRPAVDAASFSAALDELRSLGEWAAEAAIRWSGDVALTAPPVVVDVRRRVNHASGSLANPVVAALRAEGTDAVLAVPGEALPADRQPVVVTRHPLSDPKEADALRAVLEARPDSVVVHGGVRAAAPAVERLICMHGLGLVNARAAAQLLTGARR
ncbi:glycoside hydrolase family 3 N-terminal domain-containing protein [Tessaracoccus defluvii]